MEFLRFRQWGEGREAGGSRETRQKADLALEWECANMGSGRVVAAERGIPQGAVISPLLTNIYLH